MRAQRKPAPRSALVTFAGTTKDTSSGMTFLEVIVVVAIAMVLCALALPAGQNSLQNYHLHSDAASVAAYVNLTRMRAASQYQPYSLDFNASANTYVVEQLAPITYNPIPTSTPSSPSYSSQSPAAYEFGTQYLTAGEAVTDCRPAAISAYPGPISGNPSSCGGSFQIYFNTRGFLVDSTGGSPGNGGLAIYMTGPNNLIDAVTVSAGGAVETWNWNPASTRWSAR